MISSSHNQLIIHMINKKEKELFIFKNLRILLYFEIKKFYKENSNSLDQNMN